MKSPLEHLVPRPRSLRLTEGVGPEGALPERFPVDGLGPEAYRLIITKESVRSEASTEVGHFHASTTFEQLRAIHGAVIPCMEIEDAPELPVRAYMLDISRCRVPTVEHLERLVGLLAALKFNQLQLYTEHTFAYAGHEVVWADASPLTEADIRHLEALCGRHHIELVPNQNAFGHMERWLRHPEYKHLAESPDGFQHPIAGWKPHGSVLYPDDESLRFVDGLLNQLLPCFRSDWVHLGCDEPWELGQGRSAGRITRDGRHAVFLDYVSKLAGLCHLRGKKLLFWSDELRSDPSRIRDFPENCLPIAWGYEADHAFEPEAEAYAAAGRDFMVAPGDSSWNSFTGRLETARRNIRQAALVARHFEAEGLLLTSWGDHGHQQTWPTQLPGLLLGAQACWNPGAMDDFNLADALDRHVFNDSAHILGPLWVELASLDNHCPPRLHPVNSSFAYDALYAAPGRIRKAMRPHGEECLFNALGLLEDLEKQLARAVPGCPDGDWILEETSLAIAFSRAGLKRAQALAKGTDPELAFHDWELLLKRFRHSWLCRSRPGGLDESLAKLTHRPPPGHLADTMSQNPVLEA